MYSKQLWTAASLLALSFGVFVQAKATSEEFDLDSGPPGTTSTTTCPKPPAPQDVLGCIKPIDKTKLPQAPATPTPGTSNAPDLDYQFCEAQVKADLDGENFATGLEQLEELDRCPSRHGSYAAFADAQLELMLYGPDDPESDELCNLPGDILRLYYFVPVNVRGGRYIPEPIDGVCERDGSFVFDIRFF